MTVTIGYGDYNMVNKLRFIMEEIWKSVVGYEGLYSVSTDGRVRGERKTRDRGRGVLAIVRERILRPYAGKNYNSVSLVNGESKKTKNIHSLVAEAFLGKLERGQCVCHINGDSRDNRLLNLRYDTYSGNMLDKKKHGTNKEGVGHYKHILTEEQARYILSVKGEKTCSELADKFGVSISTISKINTGKNWKCLKK
jgi:hypothetical protein